LLEPKATRRDARGKGRERDELQKRCVEEEEVAVIWVAEVAVLL
jgi:hypothetical protein